MKNYGVIYSSKKKKNKLQIFFSKLFRSKDLSKVIGNKLKLYRSYETLDKAVNAILSDQAIKELAVKNNFYIIELMED
ncbi:MAG: hypothetical protein M0Q87_15185 [Ottowia sp.]|nr:hypothetical protein [Ottowia sp.]